MSADDDTMLEFRNESDEPVLAPKALIGGGELWTYVVPGFFFE